VSLSAELPDAAVLALPLRAGDGTAVLLGQLPSEADAVDVAALLGRESAKGGAGELVPVPLAAPQRYPSMLLVGTGDGSPADLRKAGAALARRAKDAASLAVDLRAADLPGVGLRALVEGLLLASYSFSRKAEVKDAALTSITLVGPVGLQADLDAVLVVVRATAVARDLVNTPSGEKSPAWLASTAAELLRGLDVQVLDERQLAEQGFGGILAVGQGSSRPPRLVSAGYDGGGTTHVVLIGKGITFDAGGLQLKPTAEMVRMKNDMGGAAAVLGALRAVADLSLPIRVTALAAVAENLPSGAAQRPGDVLRQYGGRTVEVLDTDAEGRLVLADALAYADRELQADVIVDVATLTGAVEVALGKRHAGLFCTDDRLAGQLEAAAVTSGEPLWRLPLVDDYRSTLDSAVADLRNIGTPKRKLAGQAIVAALYLREFTGGRPWAHLDIAGPVSSGADEDEKTKGGTGYGVRLLTAWLQELSRAPARRAPARRDRRTA
jgi:leucyl aminopeptidase